MVTRLSTFLQSFFNQQKCLMIVFAFIFPAKVTAFDRIHSIIQRPIIFNQTRIALTKEYIKKHYGLQVDNIDINPKIIVLHWTGQSKLSNSFHTFLNPEFDTNERGDLPDKLNVSTHFLVDRDGTIYQLMPETWMARHVIGLNYYAIGIENVGGCKGKHLTEAQVTANAYLVCYLKAKYKTIQYIIGHQDYKQFKNSPLWLEKNPKYQNTKSDPGHPFTQAVINSLPCNP